ncbi:endonuclease III domain-containing protein [Cystobacter fuscus]
MEQPGLGPSPGTHKQPFDLESVLERVREAIQGHAAAAMFELAERGHASLFEQLVACILSIRTRDEVSLPVALRLLSTAPTPEAMRQLGTERLQALIRPVTFPEPKARTIHDIAVRTVEEFAGALPADAQVLQSFKGVGPKCAHRRWASPRVRRTSAWTCTCTGSPTAGATCTRARPSRPSPRWRRSCPGPTGWSSTGCSFPSASTCAPGSGPGAPPAPSCPCASRWA